MVNGSLLSELENKYGRQLVAEELFHTLMELRESGQLTDEEIEKLLEQYNLISRIMPGSSEWEMAKAIKKQKEEEDEGGREIELDPSMLRQVEEPPPVPAADKDKEEKGAAEIPSYETIPSPEDVPVDKGDEEDLRTKPRAKVRPKGEEGGLRTRERPQEDTPEENPLEVPQEKSKEISVRIDSYNLNASQLDKIPQDYQSVLLDPEVTDRPMVTQFHNNFRKLRGRIGGDKNRDILAREAEIKFLNAYGQLLRNLLSPGITSPEGLEEHIRDIIYDLLSEQVPGSMRQARVGSGGRRRRPLDPAALGKRVPTPLDREGKPIVKEEPPGPALQLAKLNFKNQDIERMALNPVFTQFASQNRVELKAVHKALTGLLNAVKGDKREREEGLIRDSIIILNMLFKSAVSTAGEAEIRDIRRDTVGGRLDKGEPSRDTAGARFAASVAESKQLEELKNKIYERLMNEFQNNK